MASKYAGYMGKVMLVDLSTETVAEYPWTDEQRELYLGGKIMAAKILYDHLTGKEEPFSEENWVVIATGPLTGTGAPSSARFDISALSPQTGILASSNCGGSFGHHLKEAGFDDEVIDAAWLCGQRDGRRYDMFRERVIFPILNPQGKVLGFGGRIMGDGNPKYLNTSDTPVFNKRNGLYALNFARKEHGLKRLVLVEGYMDTVSLLKYGIPGVVATLGTALTEEQARLMKRYTKCVIIAYDMDEAGRHAADKAMVLLEEVGLEVRLLKLEGAKDNAEG